MPEAPKRLCDAPSSHAWPVYASQYTHALLGARLQAVVSVIFVSMLSTPQLSFIFATKRSFIKHRGKRISAVQPGLA